MCLLCTGPFVHPPIVSYRIVNDPVIQTTDVNDEHKRYPIALPSPRAEERSERGGWAKSCEPIKKRERKREREKETLKITKITH